MIPSVIALAAELSRERLKAGPATPDVTNASAVMIDAMHQLNLHPNAQSDFQLLQTQVRPHFVAHALQAVAARMTSDAPAAGTMLVALGDLLRTSLEQMNLREVPLRSELTRLNQYLCFQRARFRDGLLVEMDVGADTLDAHVPTLLLQPLVEHTLAEQTLLHTVNGHDQIITVAVSAARHGDELHVGFKSSGALTRLVVPFRTAATA